MIDSTAIAETVSGFFEAVDDRRWDAAQDLMTSPFHLDYSSFGGGDAADMEAHAVLSQWRRVLPGFEYTSHQLSNVDVDVAGDAASARLDVVATHTIGARTWTLVGSYRASLARAGRTWLLSGLQFVYSRQDGARELLGEARRRVSRATDADRG